MNREAANECYTFVLDFSRNSHRRHPEIPRSAFIARPLSPNGLLRSGMEGASGRIPPAGEVTEWADKVTGTREMEVLRPAILQHAEKSIRPPSLPILSINRDSAEFLTESAWKHKK